MSSMSIGGSVRQALASANEFVCGRAWVHVCTLWGCIMLGGGMSRHASRSRIHAGSRGYICFTKSEISCISLFTL